MNNPMQPALIVRRITESEDQLRASLMRPELFADKVATLKPGSRRLLEVLAVRRALKELLDGEEKAIVYDEHGAPSLQADSRYISISHTRDYVAVILSDVPVGIDIERREQRVQRVVGHFLQPDEEARLGMLSADDEQLSLALHLAWSAKEAAFKVLGQDYYDLQHLTSVSHIDWQSCVLRLRVDGMTSPLALHFDYTADYVLVWLQSQGN